MNRPPYRPSPLADVEYRQDGDHWTVVFTRDLRHPPEAVWAALTDPAQLREWAPFSTDRDLGRPGPAVLSMTNGDGTPADASDAEVKRAEPPRLLEYTWGEDLLRWELSAIPAGTRLVLMHTLKDRDWLSKTTAGWHICLDVADRLLAGAPIGPIVAERAREFGWDELNEAYAQRLDLDLGT